MEMLTELSSNAEASLYRLESAEGKSAGDGRINVYVASTPYTREICADSTLVSPEFESCLKRGIGNIISGSFLAETILQSAGQSSNVDFLNILRGGSNFDPSEGLYQLGLRTTKHYVSSQRKLTEDGVWEIVQDSYEKLFCEDTEEERNINLFFGDIVATGTSLKAGLHKTIEAMKRKKHQLNSLYFFTIGGSNTEKIFEEAIEGLFKDSACTPAVHIIYLEGRFGVAAEGTPISPKTPDTDLLVYHEGAIITPEFAGRLLQGVPGMLEACVIYDGGKRANSWQTHLREVQEHWGKMRERALDGLTLRGAVNERFPVFGRDTIKSWLDLFPSWNKLDPDKIEGLSLDGLLAGLYLMPDTPQELIRICDQRITECQTILSGGK